jgi:hypothetical protein
MGMKNRIFWVMSALVVACGATSYLLPDAPITLHESREPTAQTILVNEPSKMPANEIHVSSMPEFTVARVMQIENEDAGKRDDIRKMFHADERDNLVLNESTRLNIEKLYALNTQEELESKLQELSTVLPPEAHRQLVHLIDYFDKYITASKQIYPPDSAPENVTNALDQLKGLHSIRVTHFGSEIATLFFADEEKLNRQLLEVNAQGGRWDDGNVGI